MTPSVDDGGQHWIPTGIDTMRVLVIGYLGGPVLRVILAPYQGLGNIPGDLPLEKVPPDLRMPNTNLLLWRKHDTGEWWITRDDHPHLMPRQPDL